LPTRKDALLGSELVHFTDLAFEKSLF